MATVLLLDGNSLTYRAFFALPTDMATAGGQVTNAVFGFTSMLINLIKDHHPHGVVVAFDRPEPTFRHEAYTEYKANREAAPDILRQQMGLVREVVAALGIHAVDVAGFEADDIIATLAERYAQRGDRVIIVTGDRDSYQLVRDPDIRVLYNRRGVSDYALYDEAGIADRTGVTPALYPQYAALRGDNSDNLPGVPGVGEKTAAKLINTYGGLDGIFSHLADLTPKLRESLAANEAQARSNHELMVLRKDAPVELDLDQVAVAPDLNETRRLFEFLEFRSLFDRLNEALSGVGVAPAGPTGEVLEAEVEICSSPASAIAALTAASPLDVAPMWTGAPGRSRLLGLAVVTDAASGEVAWIDDGLLSSSEVQRALTGVSMRGNDIKALMRSLLAMGVATLPGLELDTAIAAYLIDPAESRYAVGDLLEKYTGASLPTDDPSSSGQLDFGDSGVDDAKRAARQALGVSKLAPALERALEAQGMAELYRTVENPLVGVLARMEHAGIAVDVDELRSLNDRLSAEVARLSAVLQDVAGRSFNINSPIQLREILYDERGNEVSRAYFGVEGFLAPIFGDSYAYYTKAYGPRRELLGVQFLGRDGKLTNTRKPGYALADIFASSQKIASGVGDPSAEALKFQNIGGVEPINRGWVDSAVVGSFDGELYLQLAAEHTPSARHMRAIRAMLRDKYPQVQTFFRPADNINQTLAGTSPTAIDVRFVGRDVPGNLAAAKQLQQKMAQIPGAVDIAMLQVLDLPEYRIEVDRVRALQLGVTQQEATNAVLAMLGSGTTVATNLWADPKVGLSYTVQVQAPPLSLGAMEELLNTPVSFGNGRAPVLLRAIATVSERKVPANTSRVTLAPALNVVANVQGADLGSVYTGVESALDAIRPTLKPGNRAEVVGQAHSMQMAYAELANGIAFAAVLVFLVMVVNFQSWMAPLVASSGLPFALSGAAAALWLTATPLSVPALMGMIMVVGVSTANSVLVTSFALNMLREGHTAIECAVAAASTRLRPVLMTAGAMIVGILPMALGLGDGGEQNAPLGRAVIGGLVVGTVATLVVVPAMFALTMGRRTRRLEPAAKGERVYQAS